MINPRTIIALVGLIVPVGAVAQFTNGSTGVDGALSIPVGDGAPQMIVFDPTTFDPPLDVDGDGVYHFTSITIPENITLRLRADKCGFHPLFWLVSGPVAIAGTLDLSGEDPQELPYGTLTPITIPGPGGYPGGPAELSETSLATIGFGPGGGQFPGAGGSHSSVGFFSFGVPPYGTPLLVPLIGGSGGAGSPRHNGIPRIDTVLSGGAGGGALLLSSDEAITLTGTITVAGGQSTGRVGGGFPQAYLSGDGSSGAVRLIAPVISGSGSIIAGPENFQYNWGGKGRVRLEANSDGFSGTIVGDSWRVTLLPTTPLGLPSTFPTPTVQIVSIGGQQLPINSRGTFTPADLDVNQSEPTTFEITAANVPPGNLATIYLFNETTFAQVISSEPLQGTVQSSTTTATAVISPGFTRGYVTVNWSPQ